jgi:hypothetical protein
MKKIISFFIIVIIASVFNCCSQKVSVGSEDDPTVTIKNIWFSNYIDKDNDGYSSYARLNLDLDTNTDDFSIIVKISVRPHSNISSDPYDIYFQSAPFTINGETTGDAVYTDIGGSNAELTEGHYDFLVQVYSASDLSEIMAEVSAATHIDINAIKFENSYQDLTEMWLSYIDDGIFESLYKIPERPPLGVSYSRLTEKFERPQNAGICILKKVRVHIPVIDNIPGQIIFTIYNNEDNVPGEALYTSMSYSVSSNGWNTFDLEYDLTGYDVFYISIPPSSNYGVSIDNNSAVLNGYWYEYVTSNPPREGWVKQEQNYAIEVLLAY